MVLVLHLGPSDRLPEIRWQPEYQNTAKSKKKQTLKISIASVASVVRF